MTRAVRAAAPPEPLSASLLSRHEAILETARRTGRVTVEALAERLNVTPQTIRKDLNHLSARSLLGRVHGGAVVTSGVGNLAHEARRRLMAEEKRAVGRAVAARIPDDCSLFISVGTTTEEVARALAGRRGLMVITNNLNVADVLQHSPDIEVVVAGGRVRVEDRAVVGALAVDFIGKFKVDVAVVGASALDRDGSLLDFDAQEVAVAQAILKNSRSRLLAVDRSKLGRAAPVRIGHVSSLEAVVIDRMTDAAFGAVCADHGVEIVEAGLDDAARPPP